MTSGPVPTPSGPAIKSDEELCRGITGKDWWVAAEGRPSSAAFRKPRFSVDIASRLSKPEDMLGRLPPGSGIAAFSCGDATELGYDAREEIDPNFPDNKAHAHVYFTGIPSKLSKAAAKLALRCKVICAPTFA